MSNLRKFSRTTILYAIGTFIQRGASLLLIPVYTAVLQIAQYGTLETLDVIFQTLVIAINFGLSTALMRFYATCKDEDDAAVMIRTSLVLLLVLSFGLFALSLPFMSTLGRIFLKNEKSGLLVVLVFLWAIGGSLNQQVYAYYRARQNAGTYVALSISIFFILVTLNVIFVRVFYWGVVGVVLGNLIVTWMLNLYFSLKFFHIGFSISWDWAEKFLRFGMPLVFGGFGLFILNSADRYFLAYYRDMAEVGLYGLGYKAGSIVQIAVISPFTLGWGPYVFSRFEAVQENAKQEFGRMFTYIMFIFCLFSIATLSFSSEIIAFLGSGKYAEAVQVMPYVLFAYLFYGIYFYSSVFFHLKKRTALLSSIITAMAALNLLLNWLWIPRMGWKGAALSTVVSIAGTGLITLFGATKLYPIIFDKLRLFKLGISTVIPVIIFYSFPEVTGIHGFIIHAAIPLVMPVFLFLIGFFDSSEIRFMVSLPSLVEKKLLVLIGRQSI